MTLEQIIQAVTAVTVAILTGGGAWAYFTEKAKAKRAKENVADETDEARAARIGQLQVAEVERLNAAYIKINERFDQLAEEFRIFRIESAKREERALEESRSVRGKLARVQDIVTRWWSALQEWNAGGNVGAMPIPSPSEMHELEIDLPEATTEKEPQP